VPGREAPAVVLCANWLGLASVSGANPNQFGNRPLRRPIAHAPTTAASLPSMRQLTPRSAAQRPRQTAHRTFTARSHHLPERFTETTAFQGNLL
jgi:hypothetical protein